MERKIGFTVDSLISADVRLVKASAEENEDLSWGLKGGGGRGEVRRREHPRCRGARGGIA